DSEGCTKKDSVPVLSMVAVIFAAIWPDLPMPVTVTRPGQASMRSQAFSNCESIESICFVTAAASISNTRRPAARKDCVIIALIYRGNSIHGRGVNITRFRRQQTNGSIFTFFGV